eukprot:TRINITY_DN927_c0_g1_i1.p1 TRINITY_DN927_c0_g1~~TRINITY_DN927_c0_g1_i1.p1  ORF type:complete len:329 (-),score=73.49 TRINITY_DN927_c0_g1_i1:292-1278(-)
MSDLLVPPPPAALSADVAPPPVESKFNKILNYFNTGFGSPGKLDEWNREFKDVSGTQEYFDGLKGETQKMMAKDFNVTQGVQLGGSENSGNFTFTTNIAIKEQTLFVGSYNSEGRKIFGRFMHNFPTIGKDSNFSLVGQVSKDEDDGSLKGMAVFEGEYNGKDNAIATRIDEVSQSISYLQSFWPGVAAGIEFTHLTQQRLNLFTGALRWQFNRTNTVFMGMVNNMSGIVLNYFYNGKGFTAATEYSLSPTQAGGVESVFTGAVRYEFSMARYRFRANTKGVVGCLYEEQIADNMKIAICADFDLIKPHYRFGLGFTFIPGLPEGPAA